MALDLRLNVKKVIAMAGVRVPLALQVCNDISMRFSPSSGIFASATLFLSSKNKANACHRLCLTVSRTSDS